MHIAKQLSQKKYRSKIGAIHLTHIFGDSRKVGLILTPPLDNNEVDSSSAAAGGGSKKGKKKRRRGGDVGEGEKSKSGDKKKNKLRFRIRLIFGVKGQVHGPGEVEYSSDESMDEAATAKNSCWIPRSRLLPNRNNNRSLEKKRRDDNHDDNSNSSTPHYTNSLAEDLHLLSTTNLINSTLSTLTSTGANITPTSTFHETLILLKVWALQRGFLRGHDTFTTTTLAVILVYLYRTKAIGKRMGCIQAFITFMKFWSARSMSKCPRRTSGLAVATLWGGSAAPCTGPRMPRRFGRR